jgi:hypothetical protein
MAVATSLIFVLELKLDHIRETIKRPIPIACDDDDDDVYLKNVATRVSQNLILHKNADQPKA